MISAASWTLTVGVLDRQLSALRGWVMDKSRERSAWGHAHDMYGWVMDDSWERLAWVSHGEDLHSHGRGLRDGDRALLPLA